MMLNNSAIGRIGFGKFIKKGLMVGATLNFQDNDAKKYLSFLPHIQYFMGINKNLFVQAKAAIGINYSSEIQESIDLSTGVNYFLTPYVMLETRLIELSSESKPWKVGPNIGLKYFLK
jgi:hypothetical protein